MNQNPPETAAPVERDEPVAGPSAVPIWLILLLGLLLYWGMNYVNDHGGWFNAQVYEPFRSYEEVAQCHPHNPEGDYLALGEATFKASCIACHQANGAGKEGQFPPLAGSDWLLAPSATRIGRIVLRGLNGSLRVEANGKLVNLNAAMAPLGDSYDDEHLAAALTYVRQQWGNNAAKITPEEIKAIRAAVGSHPGPFTPDELLQIPLQPPK